jgi:nucleoside-triphosphatase
LVAKRIFLLTGAPGIGKTTALSEVVDTLKTRGTSVGGMMSCELREGGVRVGFEVVDLTSGKRGWLAHVSQKTGPQVGRYHVNLADLEAVGVKAIEDAIQNSAILAIDEIGPMELFSRKFRQAVKDAVESPKVVIAIVHAKARDPLITQVKQRSDAELFEVTLANRDGLAELLTEKILTLDKPVGPRPTSSLALKRKEEDNTHSRRLSSSSESLQSFQRGGV